MRIKSALNLMLTAGDPVQYLQNSYPPLCATRSTRHTTGPGISERPYYKDNPNIPQIFKFHRAIRKNRIFAQGCFAR